MIKIGIVGGTGYTGAELLRLLTHHREAEVVLITSRAETGKAVTEIFPHLTAYRHLQFSDPNTTPLTECDVVFYATPHGIAMKQAVALLEKGLKIIDLSADFRITDPEIWFKWYKMKHECPDLLPKAVYGLPEILRESIKTAQLIANPGCYATSMIVGLAPLLARQLIDPTTIIADGKSGVSGAGRKADLGLLLCETSESFKAYGIGGHRHQPEVEQILSRIAGVNARVCFVPHLVPMIRGIETTLYAFQRTDNQVIDLQAIFAEFYRDEPFIQLLNPGVPPETRQVKGTNLCQISVNYRDDQNLIVVSVAIDNLIKGASGQAIQNMNIMFGLDETHGLGAISVLP